MPLVSSAYACGLAATRALSREEQKRLGQFVTPPAIARFMAARAVAGWSGEALRILEPAAGSGVLAAAAVEAALALPCRPRRIELVAHELDARLIPALHALSEQLAGACAEADVRFECRIEQGDFLLSDLALSRQPTVDLVIANPPYFKLAGRDPRARMHDYAVHGQPNIYGLFMAACASLLRSKGRHCFITPRSWMSGSYFGAVRRHLLRHLRFDAFHTFDSRSEHFSDDDVLQEAVIAWATEGSAGSGRVLVSSSRGVHDLGAADASAFDHASVIQADAGRTIVLPDARAGSGLRGCTATLSKHGLQVSTGPVVAFRAAAFIREERTATTVPLLWMQHIAPLTVRWPVHKKKEHIEACDASAWMLVPNSHMVVLRRFSPKEDARRITASAYLAGSLPGAVIGLENHLNYIHRPGKGLSMQEALGLAAYLSSRPVDDFFRTLSGNTQVNAADLRRLPLPAQAELNLIGALLGDGPRDLDRVDRIVGGVLGSDLPKDASLHWLHA